MIFFNPSGAPELACEQCGCRWFDRMSNTCYECGAEMVPHPVKKAAAKKAVKAAPKKPAALKAAPKKKK